KYLLNKMMYQVTLKSLNEADVILLVVDREYFALGVVSDETAEFPSYYALGTFPTKRPNES
ncbi:MAG: hypothetical protein Q8881_04310, partial [Sweet potato little leaf phytoplasma]|nr:hypothetical protein [Sweet potato little leaf phytoplasma]